MGEKKIIPFVKHMQEEAQSCDDSKKELSFSFEPSRSTNVHIKTKDNGSIFVHSLLLEMRSNVFREIEYNHKEKTIIQFDFSFEASLAFFHLLYAIDIKKVELKHVHLLEIWKITFQYDTKEYFVMITQYVKELMEQVDEETDDNHQELFSWSNIGNLAMRYKEMELIDFIFTKHVLYNQFQFDPNIVSKLNCDFKDYLLSRLLSIQFETKKRELLEVQDEYGDWYISEVIQRDSDRFKIHYQGFSSTKDKWMKSPPNLSISNTGTREIKQQTKTQFGVKIQLLP